MATTSRQCLEVVMLICCVAFTGVLTNCVGNEDITVEEKTKDVPLVIKGIVTDRSHTSSHITIRIGKILKGKNESFARNELELVILEEQPNTTWTTTARDGLINNVTDTVNSVTSHKMTTLPEDNSLATNESTTDEEHQTISSAVPCLEGVGLFDRYIFFLRPLDDEGVLFEVARDGVPQSKDNLRRIRQAVKEEEAKEANETQQIIIPDSHHAPCENGSRWQEAYCMNGGRCAIWKNLDKHFCICRYPYSGERCHLVDPGLYREDPPIDLNPTTLGIAVILAALLLVLVICGVAYIRYKNSIWREREKEVEKAVKYLHGRYPSPSSRRESPVDGVLRLKRDSSNSDSLQQVVIFQQDSDGKLSRAGSLSSNQYRLLTEHNSNGDFRDQNSNRASRSSIV